MLKQRFISNRGREVFAACSS